MMKGVLTLFLIILLANFSQAQQNTPAFSEQIQQYEPSEEFPFGRMHPDAPPETKQFEFMVGICDCVDSLRNRDGSWFSYPSIWRAKYFLNGHAIQDNYFNLKTHTSNLRVFDPKTSTWKVTFIQLLPTYFTGNWEGEKEGDNIVLKQESINAQGQKYVSRLTFYNISEDGYDWVAEQVKEDGTVNATWKQFCKKRK